MSLGNIPIRCSRPRICRQVALGMRGNVGGDQNFSPRVDALPFLSRRIEIFFFPLVRRHIFRLTLNASHNNFECRFRDPNLYLK
jgi:hypothetical protein